jgi:hypothetical protein
MLYENRATKKSDIAELRKRQIIMREFLSHVVPLLQMVANGICPVNERCQKKKA